MGSLTPLATTLRMTQMCARHRRYAQTEGMVTFAVVSGLTTATLVMLATLARSL